MCEDDDAEVVARLCRQEAGRLRVYLRSSGVSPASSEEILHDAFLVVHRKRVAVAAHLNKPALLFTIVKGVARDRWKADSSRSARDAKWSRGMDRQPLDPFDDVAGQVDLVRALARLSEKQREVAVRHWWMDQSLNEVAAAMGISRGAVNSHIERAKPALRRLLADDPERRTGRGSG